MANWCEFKIKKTKEEVIDNVISALKEKFGFNPAYIQEDNGYSAICLNGLRFPIWEEDGSLFMYDVATTPLWHKDNYDADEYKENQRKYFFIDDLPSAYSYLHHYIQNLIALKGDCLISSDGAGEYSPFSENKHKYESYRNWLDFFTRDTNVIKRLLKSKDKSYNSERKFFPELF